MLHRNPFIRPDGKVYPARIIKSAQAPYKKEDIKFSLSNADFIPIQFWPVAGTGVACLLIS